MLHMIWMPLFFGPFIFASLFVITWLQNSRFYDFGPFEQFEIDWNLTIEKIESQSLNVDQIIKSRISYVSYARTWLLPSVTVYDILFWSKKYTPSIYKWLKFFWTTKKYFWFTNRILLPCYHRISSLKRISEKFRIIQRVKHWMQFMSLAVGLQWILLLNSKTIGGVDWPIWIKDGGYMAQSPLKVKQWSSVEPILVKRKLNYFQRLNEHK